MKKFKYTNYKNNLLVKSTIFGSLIGILLFSFLWILFQYNKNSYYSAYPGLGYVIFYCVLLLMPMVIVFGFFLVSNIFMIIDNKKTKNPKFSTIFGSVNITIITLMIIIGYIVEDMRMFYISLAFIYSMITFIINLFSFSNKELVN